MRSGARRRGLSRPRAFTLIEVLTYRRLGHAQHDNQSYQSAEEIERWAAENDPLDRFVATLAENGWVTSGTLARIDEEIAREIEAAVEEAEGSPMPEPETVSRSAMRSTRRRMAGSARQASNRPPRRMSRCASNEPVRPLGKRKLCGLARRYA